MPFASSPDLLVLHGVRILGMGDTDAVARRYGLDRDEVQELLLDHEASGRVQHASFADTSGWSLTSRGREEDQRLLAAELHTSGAHGRVSGGHSAFAPLNARFLQAVTRWQIRPGSADTMAANDHTDWAWDEDVLETLASLSRRLEPIGQQLADALDRFDGYPERFAAALIRVDQGHRAWVDAPRIDSCHTVWFELHEDLLSTLGLERDGAS